MSTAPEGFIGMGLKKDEFVQDCSDIDDIIVFRRDGVMKVVRVGEKVFVGKDISTWLCGRKTTSAPPTTWPIPMQKRAKPLSNVST
jgi:hypothetical protein